MRLTNSFWSTFKEDPTDAKISSHKLMIRSGLLHKSGAGIYNFMPLSLRIIKKIENIVREEMDKIGCQEISMSVITPGELWKKSNRFDQMNEMLSFEDKNKQILCMSPTNEEAVVDIFQRFINSYKQLPVALYQINTKFRDEIRPRFGIIRAREFVMKDAYSFHNDLNSLEAFYNKMYEAYQNCFKRMGLEFIVVEANAGVISSGTYKNHEFQVLSDSGEDKIVYEPNSNYSVNIEMANTNRDELAFNKATEEIEYIKTIDKKTIESVCDFLNVPKYYSLKSLVYTYIKNNKKNHVLAMLLGDDNLNEIKLKSYLNCDHLFVAKDSTLEELKLPKGFIGPYKLDKIRVIYDNSIDVNASYVIGALKKDYHLKNFIPSRDGGKLETIDIRFACEGDKINGNTVLIKRGIEVGHIFQLGSQYTESMNAKILDKNGKQSFPLMGCYGIGITRIMAAAIEQNHDDKGIIWSAAIAPYQVYFILISKDEKLKKISNGFYNSMINNNLEVLFDDRECSAGIKFKDAELLGIPLILTLGDKTYNQGKKLELSIRKTGEKIVIRYDLAINIIKDKIKEL